MDEQPVRYGIYLPPTGPSGDPATLVDLSVRAEQAGWDGIFLWDYVVADSMAITDTWTTLAAIGTATRTTPAWSDGDAPTTTSTLDRDQASILGEPDLGGPTQSRLRSRLGFSRFGEPTALSVRRAMLEEGLEVLRGVWSGRRYRHAGRHYRIELGESLPEPYGIPLWMAGSTGRPSVLERANRCEGIFHNPEGE